MAACSYQTGDRVLFPQGWDRYGNSVYDPSIVVSLEHDEGGTLSRLNLVLFGEDPSVDANVFWCDAEDFEDLVPYSDDNAIRCSHANFENIENHLDWSKISQETAIRRLKVAAEGRSIVNFAIIVRRLGPRLPLHTLGPELLRLALLPSEVPFARSWRRWAEAEDEEEEGANSPERWASDLGVLLKWIQDNTSASLDAFISQEFKHGTTLEHVAAERGDTKLLVWYIENCEQLVQSRYPAVGGVQLPRDEYSRTPVHHAVQNGHANVVWVYEAGGSFGRYNKYISRIEDFDAKDGQGRTASDLAKHCIVNDEEGEGDRAEMAEALQELQRMIYQHTVREALVDNEEEDATDYCFLKRIVSEYNLVVGDPTHGDQAGLKAILHAISKGQLRKLQWLLETVEDGTLSSVQGSEDNLLHIAAQPGDAIQSVMDRRAARYSDDSRSSERKDCDNEKKDFLQSWDGIMDVEEFTGMFLSQEHRRFLSDSWVQANVEMFGERKLMPKLLATVRWLIQKGFDLPETQFLVKKCYCMPALEILQYRLDTDAVIDHWFQDEAPLAMVLVKEYLHPHPESISASDIVLMCVEPSTLDPLNVCEVNRLKILQCLIRRYGIDPKGTTDPDGNTILHVAVRNGFGLIAGWLSVTYPQLLYTRGSNSGKLPVHVALESTDGVMHSQMMGLTSDSHNRRFEYDWSGYARLWLLSDLEGRTVRDYALKTDNKSLRVQAQRPLAEKCLAELLSQIAKKSSLSDIISYYQNNQHLLEFIELESGQGRKKEGHFRLVHAAIGFGRLDILCWLSEMNPYFAQSLASVDSFCSFPMLPIICHNVECKVGDLVEVSCTFRTSEDVLLKNGTQISPSILDGEWMIDNWLPTTDGVSCALVVHDLWGFADIAGLDDCEFSILESGVIVAKFSTGTILAECWATLLEGGAITNPSNSSLSKLELRRLISNEDGTQSVCSDSTERSLIMTRAGKSMSPPATWRLAKVIDATETDLKIRYIPLDHLPDNIEEWMPRASTRINRKGILQTKDYPPVDWFQWERTGAQSLEKEASGHDFAERCNQQKIVKWIDSFAELEAVAEKIEKLDKDFMTRFASDCCVAELQSLISEARGILDDSAMPNAMKVSLQTTHYVLDRCWADQPVSEWTSICLKEEWQQYDLRGLGMMGIAAVLGRLDRVQWILDSGRLSMDSDCIREAAVKSTMCDRLEILQELISRGLVVTTTFAVERPSSLIDDAPVENKTLIQVASTSLSGKVACFLLDSGYVPDDHLSTSLLTNCVRRRLVGGPNKSESAAEKAKQRVDILERLCSRGLRPLNTTDDIRRDSTMHTFVGTLHENQTGARFECIPVTKEALEVLCRVGGDVVTACRDYYYAGGGPEESSPSWLTDYVDTVESSEDLFRTLLSEEFSVDAANDLVGERDVVAMRDRSGRSLLQLAAGFGGVDMVEWLLRSRGADADETDLNGQTIRNLCRQLGRVEIVDLVDSCLSAAKR